MFVDQSTPVLYPHDASIKGEAIRTASNKKKV